MGKYSFLIFVLVYIKVGVTAFIDYIQFLKAEEKTKRVATMCSNQILNFENYKKKILLFS
jgi:hypothetical protein